MPTTKKGSHAAAESLRDDERWDDERWKRCTGTCPQRINIGNTACAANFQHKPMSFDICRGKCCLLLGHRQKYGFGCICIDCALSQEDSWMFKYNDATSWSVFSEPLHPVNIMSPQFLCNSAGARLQIRKKQTDLRNWIEECHQAASRQGPGGTNLSESDSHDNPLLTATPKWKARKTGHTSLSACVTSVPQPSSQYHGFAQMPLRQIETWLFENHGW